MDITSKDIAGNTSDSVAGWQARVEALCNPKHFEVNIELAGPLYKDLTDEEINLLEPRLKLVEKYASFMAAGMLKGVIKYASNIETVNPGNDPEKWQAHLLGEGADFSNYQALLVNALEINK